PPDPTNIPGGCRFHARCHILASGEAERAGVADACRTKDLPVLGGHEAGVACHWATAREEAATGREGDTSREEGASRDAGTSRTRDTSRTDDGAQGGDVASTTGG
ncbi:hypothetical protein GA0115246_100951, partial [Streptomyces sp. SolWspMP-sol7th]